MCLTLILREITSHEIHMGIKHVKRISHEVSRTALLRKTHVGHNCLVIRSSEIYLTKTWMCKNELKIDKATFKLAARIFFSNRRHVLINLNQKNLPNALFWIKCFCKDETYGWTFTGMKSLQNNLQPNINLSRVSTWRIPRLDGSNIRCR